jgi:hypothetical protein
LKSQIPLPHVHHILAPPSLEKAYQSFDAAVDCEDIPYSGGGGREVSEVVEGIDEGKCRGTIEGSAVVEGRGDAHRCLVDIRDTKIDFSHDGVVPHDRDEGRICLDARVSGRVDDLFLSQ